MEFGSAAGSFVFQTAVATVRLIMEVYRRHKLEPTQIALFRARSQAYALAHHKASALAELIEKESSKEGWERASGYKNELQDIVAELEAFKKALNDKRPDPQLFRSFLEDKTKALQVATNKTLQAHDCSEIAIKTMAACVSEAHDQMKKVWEDSQAKPPQRWTAKEIANWACTISTTKKWKESDFVQKGLTGKSLHEMRKFRDWIIVFKKLHVDDAVLMAEAVRALSELCQSSVDNPDDDDGPPHKRRRESAPSVTSKGLQA